MSLLTLKSKLIVGAIVLTIVATTGVLTVNRIKADAFKAGQVSERQLHAEALQKAQEANDAQTAGLRTTITDYAARIDVLSHQRRDREQVIVTKIEERLVDQPNCQITPDLLALRNQIRTQ